MSTHRPRPTLRETFQMSNENVVVTYTYEDANTPIDKSVTLHVTAREKLDITALLVSPYEKYDGFWPSNRDGRERMRDKLVGLRERGFTHIYAHGWGGPQITLKWVKAQPYTYTDSDGSKKVQEPDAPYHRMRMEAFGDYPSAIRRNLAFLEMVGLRAHKARYGHALETGYVSDDIFVTPEDFINAIPKPFGATRVLWDEESREYVSK